MKKFRHQLRNILVYIIAVLLSLAPAVSGSAAQKYSNISDLANVNVSGNIASVVLDYYTGRSNDITFAAAAVNKTTGEVEDIEIGTKSGTSGGEQTFSVDLSLLDKTADSEIRYFLWDENQSSVINSKPTGINEYISESKVVHTKIAWEAAFDDNEAITSYKIYDAATDKFLFETKSLYYIDGRARALLPGTEYKYKVTAVDSNGNETDIGERSAATVATCASPYSWNENVNNGIASVIVENTAREGYAELKLINGRTALLAPSSRSLRDNGQVYSLAFKSEKMESAEPYDILYVTVNYLDTAGGELKLYYKYLNGSTYSSKTISGPTLYGSNEWKTYTFVLGADDSPKPYLVAGTNTLSNGQIAINAGKGNDLYVSDISISDSKYKYAENSNIGAVSELSAQATASGVALSWNAPSAGTQLVEKYNIYDNNTGFLIGESFALEYTDMRDFDAGYSYEYKVVAVDENGLEGAESVCVLQNEGGSGDNESGENDVIIINNAEELANMATQINGSDAASWNTKYYKLGADLDLNNEDWTPIGSASSTAFKGTFDGDGHVIKNLKVTLEEGQLAAGLFGYINGATVKNVGIDTATVTSYGSYDGNTANRQSVGVLIGAVVNGSNNNTITSCFVRNAEMNIAITLGTTGGTNAEPLLGAGPIVGDANSSTATTSVATVTDCYSQGITITGNNGSGGKLTTKNAAAGLVGGRPAGWSFTNCYAANISISNFTNYAKIFRGSHITGVVTDCFYHNVSLANGSDTSSGKGTEIENADDLKAVPEELKDAFKAVTGEFPALNWENVDTADTGGDTGGDTGEDTGGDTGGDAGEDTGGDTGGDTGEDTGGDTGGDTGEDTGGDTGGDTGEDTGEDTGGDTGEPEFGGGDGNSAETAYEINTAEQLAYFAKTINEGSDGGAGKFYKLTADLDLNNEDWTPIGSTSSTAFKGTFDGDGHVIKNLKVTLEEGQLAAGLFGYINGATVKNVGIDTATVTSYGSYDGNTANRQSVGVLIGAVVNGSNNNTITSCFVRNAVMNVAITSCTSGGTNAEPLYGAGPIVGDTAAAGTCTSAGAVSDCYSRDITITGNNGSGGKLTTKNAAAGLVGGKPAGWSFTNCYAANISISNFTNYAKIFRGSHITGVVTDCFYHNVSLANGSDTSSGKGTEIESADDLKAVPEALSDVFKAVTGGFPALKWEDVDTTGVGGDSEEPQEPQEPEEPDFAGGDGSTEADAIVIEDAQQLALFAEYVNGDDAASWNTKYYKLGGDIDLSGVANWTPIGSTSSKAFKGTFDGAGHVIENLTVALGSGQLAAGLFGYINGATVKNVGIDTATVTAYDSYDGATANRQSVGVLIGVVVNGSENNVITSCFVRNALMNVTITSDTSGGTNDEPLYGAGPIVGDTAAAGTCTSVAAVSDCYSRDITIAGNNGSSGNITTKNATAGLVGGKPAGWSFTNCYAANVSISNFTNFAKLFRGTHITGDVTDCFYHNVTLTGKGCYNASNSKGTEIENADDLKALPEGLTDAFEAVSGEFPALEWESDLSDN